MLSLESPTLLVIDDVSPSVGNNAISKLPFAPTVVLIPVISGAVDSVNHAYVEETNIITETINIEIAAINFLRISYDCVFIIFLTFPLFFCDFSFR